MRSVSQLLPDRLLLTITNVLLVQLVNVRLLHFFWKSQHIMTVLAYYQSIQQHSGQFAGQHLADKIIPPCPSCF